jgi:uncharacterized membrane-anchored protein
MLNPACRRVLCAVAAMALGLFAPTAYAQGSPPQPTSQGPTSQQPTTQQPLTQEQRRQEERESWKAGFRAAVMGPNSTLLGQQGQLQIPNKMAFIPMPEAGRIMRAIGNTVSPRFIGLVTSVDMDEDWFATLSYLPEGYIRDDDAKEWDADELLQNLREGTEHANKDRKARGFPELEIQGWIEKPTYASADHKLVWSAGLKHKGAPSGDDTTVNYNTYVLGREGYLSLNFVTSGSLIESEKPIVRTLLAGLQFVPGKRYEEFNSSTDRVAAYGLAALVGGAALKKAGFFAVIVAFAAKFAKLGFVLVLALVGGLFKLFRGKSDKGA